MEGFPCALRSLGRLGRRFFLLPVLAALFAVPLAAQSTFGDILGIVRDQTGAVLQGAEVTLINAGTTATHKVTTDAEGNYAFRNVEVGTYQLTFSSTGFETESLPPITITARETRRIDAELKPGSASQTVVVIEDAIPVVTTDVSNLAETKQGDELVNLPVAIYSRSTGSTSPISTLTTEAGVQTDDSGDLEVLGTSPALLSVTVDGISSVGVEYSGPVNEMFPSFNSIEEIRVSESNNNAEFSGVADITTVSKAGTIHFHGGVFEYNENTVFNSNDPFALSKPRIIMNDFGGTLGGPLRIPRIITKPDSTFFFASFEGLRLPRETPIVLSVPSNNMRNGNLTSYLYYNYCEGRKHQPRPELRLPIVLRAVIRSRIQTIRRSRTPLLCRLLPLRPTCCSTFSRLPIWATRTRTRIITRSTFLRPFRRTRATFVLIARSAAASRSSRAFLTRTAR